MLKTVLSFDFRQTLLNQVWKLLSGSLLLILVPLYLNPELQGYWYTFISLAALVIIADMGFSTILLQFSAHEYSCLQYNSKGQLVGKTFYIERLSTLLKFSLKWSLSVALIVFPVVLVGGYFILNSKSTDIEWLFPWLFYGIGSIFVFVNSVLLSFIEGCDNVGGVQKIRFYTSVITVSITILMLISEYDLYALSVSLLVGTFSGTLLILLRYSAFLQQLLFLEINGVYSWWSEIIPLIWRYAISWVSGYFVFYIFTPIVFSYYGANEAGEVGLSIAICTAIFGIANIWITVVTPKINMMVAKQEYETLNPLFRRHFLFAIVTFCFGVFAFFLTVFNFAVFEFIRDRLISFDMFLMLSLGWLSHLTINSMTVYMRAHKKEPLMMLNLYSAIYISFTTVYLANNLPLDYFFIGFLSCYLWLLPMVVQKFIGFYKGNYKLTVSEKT